MNVAPNNSKYGDPATVDRVTEMICREFDLCLPPGITLDETIGCLKPRVADKVSIKTGGAIHDFFTKLLADAPIDAPSAFEILKVCLELAVFLMAKNKKYGDSAVRPIRIMSKADPEELIKVRMDDKLNRLIQGQAGEDEDVAQDFVGYWVLLQVIKRSKQTPVEMRNKITAGFDRHPASCPFCDENLECPQHGSP